MFGSSQKKAGNISRPRCFFVQMSDGDLRNPECIRYFTRLQDHLRSLRCVSVVAIYRPAHEIFFGKGEMLYQFVQNPPVIHRPSPPTAIGYLAQSLESFSKDRGVLELLAVADFLVLAFVSKDAICTQADVHLYRKNAPSKNVPVYFIDTTLEQQKSGKLSLKVQRMADGLGATGVLLSTPLDRYIR